MIVIISFSRSVSLLISLSLNALQHQNDYVCVCVHDYTHFLLTLIVAITAANLIILYILSFLHIQAMPFQQMDTRHNAKNQQEDT